MLASEGVRMASPDNPSVVRSLNEGLAGFAKIRGPEQGWLFVCECDAPSCDGRVRLDLAGYEAIRASGASVLAEGHTLTKASSTRREAAELREDAAALRAQARQQGARARRLVRLLQSRVQRTP